MRKVGQWLHTAFRKLGFNRINMKSKTAGSTSASRPLTVSRGRRPYIIAGSALALLAVAGFGTQQYLSANTVDYYHVYRDGQELGTISHPSQVEGLLAEKQQQIEETNPGIRMVLEAGKLEYAEASGFKAVPNSEETLQKLSGLVKAHAVGIAVRVEGKLIGIAPDNATAERVLEKIQAQYASAAKSSKNMLQVKALSYGGDAVKVESKELKKVEIVEQVSKDDIDISPDRITGEDELFNRLTNGTNKPTKYTVKEGDCVGCIASKFDISRQVIYQNNPWIEDDIIKVGDVLDLTVIQPVVTVQTEEELKETEKIEPPVTIQKNEEMRAGESKVITPGKPGKKLVTYKLVKQNGYLMSEEIVNEEMIEAAIPSIIVKGTKVIRGEGSGKFSWPVSNAKISSSFGQRWGRQHKGIDILGNKTIKASDEAVVEFAGQKSGYGNVVILNHKNGYKTLYGHLNSYTVSQGDIVEKGDQIGVMGNTGRSTGTHLHFEIIKDGASKNPLSYL
ncbi:peptidoglycan DD-metalloendopeptidase family protein [Paenibacillus sp. GCM10012307]|uniref:peptidoglycan DD-metalloendopeptidase family protein n=1 Tax=Paenibacillus sp. GCM10012307 TaxID=3317343 RepID=UPI003605B70A